MAAISEEESVVYKSSYANYVLLHVTAKAWLLGFVPTMKMVYKRAHKNLGNNMTCQFRLARFS